LVPMLVNFLLANETHETHPTNAFGRAHARFNRLYERARARYVNGLEWALDHRKITVAAMGTAVALALALIPFVGRDFFPAVDAGQIRMHIRGPAGLRIEETRVLFARVEEEVRRVIPPAEIDLVLQNMGRPPDSF